MSTNANNDPLLAAAETAWLAYVRGTWSSADRQIYLAGFYAGDLYRRHLQHQREEEVLEAAGDGRYCRHHDDDPAHSAICYQQGL